MKRVFEFKKGQSWDGDEEIIYAIMDYLLPLRERRWDVIKRDAKITLIMGEK